MNQNPKAFSCAEPDNCMAMIIDVSKPTFVITNDEGKSWYINKNLKLDLDGLNVNTLFFNSKDLCLVGSGSGIVYSIMTC